MDMTELLKIGAKLIQNNSDKATTGLDIDMIKDALSSLLGGGTSKGIDLGAILGNLAGSGAGAGSLMEIASSWIGGGANASIEPNQVSELLGSEKISQFAEQLGISKESAEQALADSLPEVVDRATADGGGDMLGDLLAQVGGADGAMGMMGQLFGR